MSEKSQNLYLQYINTPSLDIEICDVTLRDGEQTPGTAFTYKEKIDIAQRLDAMGIEIIEAGFPVTSKNEEKTVRDIAHLGLDSRICCLARAIQSDVDTALSCDVDIVSIFLATSDIHLKYKYNKTLDEALDGAISVVEYAKDHGLTVRFAAEDATRTSVENLIHVFKAGEEVGIDYASVADTVGIMTPQTVDYLIREIKKEIKTPLCLHCHDDLGLSTANTLAGALAGVKQIHGTINGLGERAGNTPLEELLLNLNMHYGIDRYDLSQLLDLSQVVEKYSNVPVAKNKAVVGANAFAHESGIHVSAILKKAETYELYPPQMVGGERSFVVGKHSGKAAVMFISKSIGYELADDELKTVMERVKECTEAKRGIPCERLKEMILDIKHKNESAE